tara:strand:+ start:856 stop:1095 length:240 start_codon:yes stop_codon:yes gene_type:complete
MSEKKESNPLTDWELPTIWDIIDRMEFKYLFGCDDTNDRTRNEDGTFKGDDPSTPNVNEAWKSGKSPKKKKTRKKAKKS